MKLTLLFLVFSISFLEFVQPHFLYVGKWALDMKKSKNLPESFKSVEQYTMDVQQTGDTIIVVAGLKGSGQDVKFPATMYIPNGNEMFKDDTLRAVKRWYTAQWAEKEKQFTVTSRVSQRNMRTLKEQQYTQSDVWTMQSDSVIHLATTQKFQPNDSTHSQLRVFIRMK